MLAKDENEQERPERMGPLPMSRITGKLLERPLCNSTWDQVRCEVAVEKSRRQGLGLAWHIVHCVGKQDQYVLDWLSKLNFDSYYPGVREMRPVPKKQLSHNQRQSGVVIMRPRIVPFFPRYMFVRFDMGVHGWREIFKFAGVAGMVCEGDLPVWVPDALIDSIRMREVDGAVPGKTPAKMIFAIGDEVQVINGPFASFPGVVEEIPDKPIEEIDSEARIKVLVNIFGRPTPVSLEINQVEKLG